MSERAVLIIDAYDIDDEDILFLTPDHIRGVRYCQSNIFDYASIKNCPTEKLNSGSLIGIFNSLKPGAELSIVVNQPISVMLEYDSKQIEANLKLVGFEDIKYEEKNSPNKGLVEGTLTAIKPVNKEKDIEIEIIKSEKKYNYKTNGDKIIKKANEREREDRGGYRIQKKYEKVEEIKEEPSSRYKKGRYNNTYNNVEKNEENIPNRKYNRYSKNEEPKEDVYQNEINIKEEKRVRPKRFGYSQEEKPQIFEHKTEIIETSGGDNKPGEIRKTEIVIEKSTVVDKNAELESKKRGLRKRYGKH
jgi:hypothetical protein